MTETLQCYTLPVKQLIFAQLLSGMLNKTTTVSEED